MPKLVKTVNGYGIMQLSQKDIEQQLNINGDQGLTFYVPGRGILPYYILGYRRNEFEKLSDAINWCNDNPKCQHAI
jgi:hypothetical protein